MGVRLPWPKIAREVFSLLVVAAVAIATYQALKHWDRMKAALGAWLS